MVFYSCDPGLVPEQRMRTMCTENGWSPNPADLNCFSGTYMITQERISRSRGVLRGVRSTYALLDNTNA